MQNKAMFLYKQSFNGDVEYRLYFFGDYKGLWFSEQEIKEKLKNEEWFIFNLYLNDQEELVQRNPVVCEESQELCVFAKERLQDFFASYKNRLPSDISYNISEIDDDRLYLVKLRVSAIYETSDMSVEILYDYLRGWSIRGFCASFLCTRVYDINFSSIDFERVLDCLYRFLENHF